jgi:diguanylate cyclase (GGDEF)-like protein/PAS domain S-box-containing protein
MVLSNMVQRSVRGGVVTQAPHLQLVLPLLGLVYLVYLVSGAPVPWPPAPHRILEALLSVGLLGAGIALRHGHIPPQSMVPILRTFTALLVLHVNLEWWFTPSSPILHSVLLLIAGACMTMAWKEWFFFLLCPVFLGWVTYSFLWLPPNDRILGVLAMGVTAAATAFLQWGRLRRLPAPVVGVALKDAVAAEIERERFLTAGEATQDGLWFWDLTSGSFSYNASWARLLAHKPGELREDVEEWLSRVHPGYVEDLRADIAEHLKGTVSLFSNEHRLLRKDGTYVWVSARGTCQRNEKGKPISLSGSLRDMTSVIDAGRTSLHDSFHDKLTNLPNRGFLMARLNQLTSRKAAEGNKAPLFALLFLDLDRFKVINDSLGHLAGDQLLLGVADRLRRCVRPMDMVSRFAGDEFAVLLEQVVDTDEAIRIALRIRDALSVPYDLGGKEVISGASIGVVMGHDRGDTADELLHAADTAMYHSKTQRRGQVQLFDESLRAANSRVLDLQNDLARALERNQLILHYQPYVSLTTGQIHGVEALVRWQRRPDELIGPTEFIPLAEDMGVINEIGDWVLRTACAQSVAWSKQGVPPIRMSVNISAKQLQDADFASRLRATVRETGMAAQSLELELTESTLIHTLDRAPHTLQHLSGLGIRTSVDDFGTGYSSLNYLRQFTFQTLKMDRCFVADLATDSRTRAIAKGLITLAHDLKLRVIAEGVERREQLQALTSLQCDAVQGFLISPPLREPLLTPGLRAGRLPRVVEWAQATPQDVRRLGETLTADSLRQAADVTPAITPCIPPVDVV